MTSNTDTRRYFITLAIVIAAFVGLFLLIRNKENAPAQNRDTTKIQVVTSFYPLYFFASVVGGDKAQVSNITPAGSEPHDYEPSPQNIVQIANSKLLILNGRGLESWGDKIMQIVDPERTVTLVLGKSMPDNLATDPHIWLSPPLAKIMVEKIKDAFVQVDAANAAYYVSNAVALESKLSDLDSVYQVELLSCTNRNIVTSHRAFGHLAAAYNLQQISIAGLSPDSEPSPQQLGETVRIARAAGTQYIFFESLASPKLSETIAREIGAKTLVLNPIEGLTPDELAQGKDYFTEMRSNLVNLELACGATSNL